MSAIQTILNIRVKKANEADLSTVVASSFFSKKRYAEAESMLENSATLFEIVSGPSNSSSLSRLPAGNLTYGANGKALPV